MQIYWKRKFASHEQHFLSKKALLLLSSCAIFVWWDFGDKNIEGFTSSRRSFSILQKQPTWDFTCDEKATKRRRNLEIFKLFWAILRSVCSSSILCRFHVAPSKWTCKTFKNFTQTFSICLKLIFFSPFWLHFCDKLSTLLLNSGMWSWCLKAFRSVKTSLIQMIYHID